MEWKKFNVDAVLTPYEVVEKSINGFSEATNKLLNLNLFEKSEIELIRQKNGSNFQYDLILHTKYMRSYKFVVLELFFDVILYPCALKIERNIGKELNATNDYIIANDEIELGKSIEIIFNSNKFNEIVGGLMKIASLSKIEEDELPF